MISAIEVWAPVLSRPEPDRVIVGLGKRDVSYDAGLPVVDLADGLADFSETAAAIEENLRVMAEDALRQLEGVPEDDLNTWRPAVGLRDINTFAALVIPVSK